MVGQVLGYLYPSAIPAIDFVVSEGRILRWNAAKLGPQPSAQQLADAEASAPYQSWLQTHGGDSVATAVRQAQDAITELDPEARRERNAFRTVMESLIEARQAYNALRADYVALRQAVVGAGVAVPAPTSTALANRTWPMVVGRVKQLIAAETDPTQ